MEYCKALDGLPRIANILFAIFLPILHVIYAIIYDVSKNNMVALILDILSFVLGVFVYWILDIVWIIAKHKVFSFADLIH
jgi:hypothetical protein